MKTDLTTHFNLPSYTKGKSFADASKAIEAKFKGRNDKASIETKQELLERLSQAQEYLKSLSEPSAESNTFGGGGRPTVQGVNELIPSGNTLLTTQGPDGLSGDLGIDEAAGGGPGVASYAQAATGALDLGRTAFGKTGIDTSGRTEAPEVDVAGTTIGSTLKGAQAGMAFGSLGAAVGGVLGAGAGLLGGNKAKKDAEKAELNNDLMKSNNFRPSNFALGGYTDPTDPKKEIKNLTPEEKAALDAKLKSQSLTEGIFSNNAATYDPRGDGGIFAKVGYNKQTHPNLDLGKYKDVNYFNPQVSEDGRYTLNNTKNNPANADLYKKQLSYIQSLNPKANIAMNNDSGFKPLINQQAMGGYQNKYDGLTNPSGFIQNPEGIYMDANKLGLNPAGFEAYQAANAGNTYIQPQTQAGEALSKTGDFLKNNYGSILRYAPLIGNLTNKLEKPITERGSRLDNTYQPQLFDEQALVNQVNQNNVNKGLTESSGGDLGALRTNLLASNLNKTKAISDAYMKGEQINRGEKQFQFQAGMNRDQFNAQLNEAYINRKAQDEGAYNTAKSAKREALFEDIGNIGKEETYKKMVKDMFGYTWQGKYFVDKDGKKVEKSTIDAKIKNKK